MTAVLHAPTALLDGWQERVIGDPLEFTGARRDAARLLVAWRSDDRLVDATFADVPRFLDPGDVLVVNTSATIPAAVPTEDGRILHLSTELARGLWSVELRTPCGAGSTRYLGALAGETVPLPGGGSAELLGGFPPKAASAQRLWRAALRLPVPLESYLATYGRPIRYGCVDTVWPLSAYQTVFARDPGSAEMPSAGRAFTPELVVDLVVNGVLVVPLTLHTGVSSLEPGEHPYPERYEVPALTADVVNAARAGGRRVIAVGTTATRALETVADARGRARAGKGWTDLVITPERGMRLVDGVISGWHDPDASHLELLEAVGGRRTIELSYAHALVEGYRWHEFGDLHLILP